MDYDIELFENFDATFLAGKEFESVVDFMLFYRVDLFWNDELLFGVYS